MGFFIFCSSLIFSATCCQLLCNLLFLLYFFTFVSWGSLNFRLGLPKCRKPCATALLAHAITRPSVNTFNQVKNPRASLLDLVYGKPIFQNHFARLSPWEPETLANLKYSLSRLLDRSKAIADWP